MIPDFDRRTGYLPQGIHPAPWAEVEQRFGWNQHRISLLAGCRKALTCLGRAGCRIVFLNGSFVSVKQLPNDYDGAWETLGVDPGLLDPVLLDFSNGRVAMKAKYGGELFPASMSASPGVPYLDFFQQDRNGTPKGIVEIHTENFP